MSELKKIGKFKVVEKLGQGSFGVVYRGVDPDIRRDVAIKVCTVDDVGLRKRFAREAQISGNLQHKNIVTVYAADTDENGIPFLVQELLGGEDLRDLIRRRQAITSNVKVDYLIQVARGLAHAHAHGVIHRDIKPANVRLLGNGTVKIMDFGIAKLANAETQLTQKGVTMGTASYLPPEQVRGGDLDHRADIFSFGVLAYELLTYERPFRGNTLSALVYQILYKVSAPVVSVWPECPEVLSDVVARCLEKKPEGRFASMGELLPELEAIVEEIEAGKWPALLGVSTVQMLPDLPDDTGVMSQTEIARTAKVVEEESHSPTGRLIESAATQVMPMANVPGSPPPVPPPPSLASPAAPLPPPAPPMPVESVESGPEAKTVLLSQEELTRHELTARAEQIGTLIAKGDLEAAKQRLEQTMSEKLEVPSELEASSTEVTAERALARPASGPISGPISGPLSGTLHEPREEYVPQSFNSAPADPEGTGSSTYMTAIFGLPAWQRIAAAGLMVVVVLVGIWMVLPEASPPAPPVNPTIETPPTTPPVEVARGIVVIDAVPWALVKEITDDNGALQEVPADSYSPLRMELPVGRYSIQLQYQPDGGEAAYSTCEVEITATEFAPCRAEFETVSSTTEYFKESGWWS